MIFDFHNTFRLQNGRKVTEGKSRTCRHRMLRKRQRRFRMQVKHHKRNRRQMAKGRQGKQKGKTLAQVTISSYTNTF